MADDSREALLLEIDRLRERLEALEGPALRPLTHEWLTLALEAADVFCYRVDVASGQAEFSTDPARFHRAPPDVTAGSADEAIQLIHPEDRAAVVGAWQEAVAGRQMSVEYKGAHPAADGGPAWFHTRARMHRDAMGRAVLIGVTSDVTARRREQERRQRLEAQASQAQQMASLGVLAGGIAHEFNNLLTTIQGYTDLARADLPAGAAHGYLGEVLAASRRAAELTQQILAYAGKGRFVLAPLSLAELVTQMSPLLAAAVSRKARLVLDAPGPLPLIEGDAGQLRQVILNLITNASEALGQSEGVITLRLSQTPAGRPDAPDQGFVLLEVSDTGCGMDEATAARVFEPFFSTKFTGRGLGLAAVLGIVRGHGGQISVTSAPGKGSTFSVLLPAQKRREAGGRPNTPRAGLVLVVDDEEGVRNLASLVLQQAGYEAAPAADGVEGLERFRRSPGAFAAALLDLTMPRMDGLELLAKLHEARPDLPVVLMTGYSASETGSRAEVNGTLQKPFTASALLEAIRRAVDEAR
jgi:signal transduction histidine kinase/CheY-like chemotaxis protein